MFAPSGMDQRDEMNGQSQKCNQRRCCSEIGCGDGTDAKAKKANPKGR